MGKHDQESAAVGARRATGAATGRGRGGRFSAGRKRETVLRLLRGEDLDSVSRELGITAARASRWRDQFLAAGQAGLKSRAPDARDEDHRRLQAKIGELLMETEFGCTRRWTSWRPAADLPRVGPGAVQRLRAASRDEVTRAAVSPRAGRCRPGRGASRPHPPGASNLAVSWRRVPQSLGEAAGRGDPHLEGAGAAVNAGARPPGPAPRGPRARPEGTRRHDHHGGPRCDVGNGHDGHGDHRRGVGVCVRGGRSLYGCSCIGLLAKALIRERGIAWPGPPIRLGAPRTLPGAIGPRRATPMEHSTISVTTTAPELDLETHRAVFNVEVLQVFGDRKLPDLRARSTNASAIDATTLRSANAALRECHRACASSGETYRGVSDAARAGVGYRDGRTTRGPGPCLDRYDARRRAAQIRTGGIRTTPTRQHHQDEGRAHASRRKKA